MSLNHNISATDLYSIFDLFDSKRSTGGTGYYVCYCYYSRISYESKT